MSLLRRRKAEDLTQQRFRSQHQKKKKNRRDLEVLWQNSKVLHSYSYEWHFNFKTIPSCNRNQGSFSNFILICNNFALQNKSFLVAFQLSALKFNYRHINDAVFDLNDMTAHNLLWPLLLLSNRCPSLGFFTIYLSNLLYLSS